MKNVEKTVVTVIHIEFAKYLVFLFIVKIIVKVIMIVHHVVVVAGNA